jgi:hypothetical protein
VRQGVSRLLRVAEDSGILDESEVRKLVLAGELSGNRSVQDDISRLILGKALENRGYPFNIAASVGNTRLGDSFRGRPFFLSEKDLAMHLLAVGQSGAGKTNLFYSLMDRIEKPFWAFDLKQDYRHLAVQSKGLLVIPWQELRFNPLEPPPGVAPRRWVQVFSEVFGHATALLSGSKNHLMKQLVELYRLYGLFEEVSAPYPSLHEFEELLRQENINYVRKQSDYRDTLLNRLESMNLVAGTVFDCSKGFDLVELLGRDVVFEFDGLGRDVQNLLMELLFAWVYEYRLAQGHRGEGLNHVFFLDEGKRVFSVYKERQDAAGLPKIDELTAKMREFGEGLVVADQEASKLTDSVKANTYTKLLLPAGDQKQFEAVAESMNLSEKQAEFAQQLGTGEAVVQVGNGDPVPVKLDEHPVQKSVTDEKLRRKQADAWEELSFEERELTTEFELATNPGTDEKEEDKKILQDPAELELSNGAEHLLEDVVENPFKPLTERYNGFSSRYKGNKAKDELVESGAAVERTVHSGSGRRKLLQLTDQGNRYAGDRLDLDTKRRGRGDIVHRYWQHQVKRKFEELGWTAELEFMEADVYVNLHSSELAVEIAMGNNSREVEHVKQRLEDGFDHVWILCPEEIIRDGITQRLEERGLLDQSVVVRKLREFNVEEEL